MKFNIEQLQLRGSQVLLQGWLLDEAAPVRELDLELSAGEAVVRVPIQIKKHRPDLARAFPDVPHAAHAGIFLLADCSALPAAPQRARLVGKLTGGETVEVSLLPTTGMTRAAPDPRRQLVAKGLRLVREGKWGVLRGKLMRYLARRPEGRAENAAQVLRWLRHIGADRAPIELVIDHDMGGGANSFRHELVRAANDRGNVVHLLTFRVVSLQPILGVWRDGIEQRIALPDWEVAAGYLAHCRVRHVTFNNAVSLPRPDRVVALLRQLKHRGVPLTLYVHDFFMACPSHFLLNAEGNFCAVPDASTCAECLKRNTFGFTSVWAGRGIDEWRAMWGSALTIADEIVAFSHDSVHWLSKAFPELDRGRVRVRPHASLGELRPVRLVRRTALTRIGIMGQLGHHKGGHVVAELADAIERRGETIMIQVVGTLEVPCNSRLIQQTGPYDRSRLPQIVEHLAPDLFFFPSIWPETFSYVVQELMLLGVPVACFDFGAPAERLRNYAKGYVMPPGGADQVLDALKAFHAEQLCETS